MGIHHVLATHAAHSATQSQPGGLDLIAGGLFFTALGLAAATNFRGLADAAGDVLSPGEGEPRPRWQKNPSQLSPDHEAPPPVNFARLMGGVVAFIGLNAIAAGIISIVHGHATIPQTSAIPVSARYVLLAFGAASIAHAWIPRIFAWRPRMGGYALSAARRNRWQRAASVLATIGSAVFVVCVAYGYLTIGTAAWLVSGLIGLVLFLVQRHPHHFVPTVRSDDTTARLDCSARRLPGVHPRVAMQQFGP
jgi:hypothetical protein